VSDPARWPFPTENPYPAYHAARAQAPVQWSAALDAHLVLSHEHSTAVLRDTEWSSDPRSSPQLLASLGGPGPAANLLARSLLLSDPPAHTRLRAAVNRFFTPRAM
jgi:cytochrome P450